MLVDLQVLLMEPDMDKLEAAVRDCPVEGVCLVGLRKLPDPQVLNRLKATGKALFFGAEIPLEKGHILVYPPEQVEDFNAWMEEAPRGEEALSFFNARGCAVVACHPYYKESEAAMGDRIFQWRGLDGTMVVTAESANSANDMAVDALDVIGCPASGGSAQVIPSGRAATLFVRRVETQADLVSELKGGDFWAVALGTEDRWTDYPQASPSDRGQGRSDHRRPPRRDGMRRDGARSDGARRDGRSGNRRGFQREGRGSEGRGLGRSGAPRGSSGRGR